eukprot:7386951-Prymnesium_polylepis.1
MPCAAATASTAAFSVGWSVVRSESEANASGWMPCARANASVSKSISPTPKCASSTSIGSVVDGSSVARSCALKFDTP